MNGTSSILRTIRRVIGLEAVALQGVRGAVGESYLRAVRLLAACRGKVIVTGMGKSGLIAQKIAATFSSTGTPALYLHPADAMHGDLGMAEKHDLVLAIGKSGESPELTAILPALKKIGVRIVAMTSRPRSTLAKSAQVVLLLPLEKEACPLNLAPTCSTTAALAVGDALAVALMELKGFRREHFARLHPGGPLGKRLTLGVDDVMRSGPDNPVVPAGASVERLLLTITRKQAGAANVVDRRGRLVGLVTDYDIRRALRDMPRGGNIFSMPIAKIMNPRPTAIRSGRSALEAVELMEDRRNPFNVLPVVDARGRSIGLVQIHDLRARGL
ncbi:MAG: KpsF/GutQ family sugar-phosphate isomerase [Elusimicrobia bacterium]|nr:KpsF/GutQ family sugar-phosphate isomerase [Elusimicrobiota bacterium]